jgi:hypothetical protein
MATDYASERLALAKLLAGVSSGIFMVYFGGFRLTAG